MSNSGDDSVSNRYGFHAHRPTSTQRSTLTQPGVGPEFAHQILDRVKKLATSIETVQNPGAKSDTTAKSDSTDHKQKGIDVLKECALRVDEQLNETNHQLTP